MVFIGLLLVTVPGVAFVLFAVLLFLDLQSTINLGHGLRTKTKAMRKFEKQQREKMKSDLSPRLSSKTVLTNDGTWITKQQERILGLYDPGTQMTFIIAHLLMIALMIRGIVQTSAMVSALYELVVQTPAMVSTLMYTLALFSFFWTVRYFEFPCIPSYFTTLITKQQDRILGLPCTRVFLTLMTLVIIQFLTITLMIYGIVQLQSMIYGLYALIEQTSPMVSALHALALSLVSFLWTVRYFLCIPSYFATLACSLYGILFMTAPANFLMGLRAVMRLCCKVHYTVLYSACLAVSNLVQLRNTYHDLEAPVIMVTVIMLFETEYFFIMTVGALCLYYGLTVLWVVVIFEMVHSALSIRTVYTTLYTLEELVHLCVTYVTVLFSWITYAAADHKFNHSNVHGDLLVMLMRMLTLDPAMWSALNISNLVMDSTDHPPQSPAYVAFHAQQTLSLKRHLSDVRSISNDLQHSYKTRFNQSSPKVGLVLLTPFPILLHRTLEQLCSLQSTNEGLLKISTLTSEQRQLLQALRDFLCSETQFLREVHLGTQSQNSPTILATAKRQSHLLVQFGEHDRPSWTTMHSLSFCARRT